MVVGEQPEQPRWSKAVIPYSWRPFPTSPAQLHTRRNVSLKDGGKSHEPEDPQPLGAGRVRVEVTSGFHRDPTLNFQNVKYLNYLDSVGEGRVTGW